jgi:hypothetical protein
MRALASLDEILARLQGHFDEVTVSPPASEAALARVRGLAPAPLLTFWRQCNGLQVGIDDIEDGEIFGIDAALDTMEACGEDLDGLLPLRGDGCGDYDCLVLGPGPCQGAVVFWDHEISEQPAYLLAGTLDSYLAAWADYLLFTYASDGARDPRTIAPTLSAFPWVGTPERQHPWPFDEAWLRAHDPAADRLLSDPEARGWLSRQDAL